MTNTQEANVALSPDQENLLLPLWSRAVELEQARPIIRDPYAGELVSRIIYDFERLERAFGRMRPLWAIRAHTFDQVLRAYIARHPQATIVHLAASLNTTFYRVDNGQITWYDVDSAEILALRQRLMAPAERVRHLAAPELDRAWMNAVNEEKGLFLVAAGVLPYQEKID